MAFLINTIDLLKEYFDGVLSRADHHAPNVTEVIFPLIGAVINTATDDISVRQYDGRPANVLWFVVNGKKYALTYNHKNDNIELRERTQNGAVLTTFDNTTTTMTIKQEFLKL